MAGRRGTAVVLDVRSGQMLAAYRLEVAARRVARPGSSIKPFTLMALLEAGKVDEHTALVCKRQLSIAGHKLDCSHPQTAQPLDPAAALAYSCNSYFINAATASYPFAIAPELGGRRIQLTYDADAGRSCRQRGAGPLACAVATASYRRVGNECHSAGVGQRLSPGRAPAGKARRKTRAAI